MSSDLERFLQQAAERLAQKVSESAQGNKPRRPAAPIRQAERMPPNADVVEAKIVETRVLDSRIRRELGPDPLSTIDTRPPLAKAIDDRDEQMSAHVHEVLDHQVSNLKKASSALASPPRMAAQVERQVQSTNEAIELDRRSETVNPLIAVLRKPETLRAAFIVGEIFARRN